MGRYHRPSNRDFEQGKRRPEVSFRPEKAPYYATHALRQKRLAELALKHGYVLQQPEQEMQLEFGNKELPAYEKKQEFLKLIDENRVVVVVGPTGSGKSTQIPQYLFERGYTTTITQPRIMAANNVCERIENEMAEVIGRYDALDAVAVHTSERDTTKPTTRIEVLTDGLKLAQMLGKGGEVLDEVIVVDEVHEWNMNIELTVAMAKRMLTEHPNLRVVLMSATVEAHALANYFADAIGSIPPILEIEGRSFPVERTEAPDSTVVEQALLHADSVGSMLIFVPGLQEIQDTIDELHRRLPGNIMKTATILPLHAQMSKREQDRVMETCSGLKIIVATNVAQTSLTIPGVDLVIDSGLERRNEIDEADITGLELHECSQADMDQRAGRTGRNCPGKYIHTSYNDESIFVPYIAREKYSTPEIWRTDISRSVLRSASSDVDFEELDLFHPVDSRVVRRAKDVLYQLGALDEDDQITGIGEYMNRFPVRPVYGRMLYESSQYSERIRGYMSAITASMEAGGLQRFGKDIETRWKTLVSDNCQSDLEAQLDIFLQLMRARSEKKLSAHYIFDYDLNPKYVERALRQYEKIARRAGVRDVHRLLIEPSEDERERLRECIIAAMADNTYLRTSNQRGHYAYRHAADSGGEPRQLSNRTAIAHPMSLITGSPYRIELTRGGERFSIGIVEQATNVSDPAILARVATRLCQMGAVEQEWRGGVLYQTAEMKFMGVIPVGTDRRHVAEWSPGVRDAYIHRMFEVQGPYMRELLAIKKRHEAVARRSKEPLAIVTQAHIERWLYDVTTKPVKDLSEIDSRLRTYATKQLQALISPEDETRIFQGAPDEVQASDGSTVRINYSHGVPTVKGTFTLDQLVVLFRKSSHIPNGEALRFHLTDERHRTFTLDEAIAREDNV